MRREQINNDWKNITEALTMFMSTQSSSNQEVVSLSLRTLAMYMHANAII
jgi:hypothetical protein